MAAPSPAQSWRSYRSIVAAVEESRAIFAKFLRYLLSSNIGEVLTMFFGVVCRARTGTTICWPPRVGRSRKRGARPDRDLLSGGRRQPQQIASFQPVGRELFTHELAASFCEREPSCRISGRERKEAAGTWQQTESCGAGTARDVRNDPRSPRYVNCSFIRTCGSSQGSAHFGSTANVCESARGRRAIPAVQRQITRARSEVRFEEAQPIRDPIEALRHE
jgi:hypothetical protein